MIKPATIAQIGQAEPDAHETLLESSQAWRRPRSRRRMYPISAHYRPYGHMQAVIVKPGEQPGQLYLNTLPKRSNQT